MAEWSWVQMRWLRLPGRDIEDGVLRMEGCKLNVVRREGIQNGLVGCWKRDLGKKTDRWQTDDGDDGVERTRDRDQTCEEDLELS